jgi:hypothetical protein
MKDFALPINDRQQLSFHQEGDNLSLSIFWSSRPPDVSMGSITTVQLTPAQVAVLRDYFNEEAA